MHGTHFKHDHAFYAALLLGGIALGFTVIALSVFMRVVPAPAPIATTPEFTAQANTNPNNGVAQTRLYIPPSAKIRTTITIAE